MGMTDQLTDAFHMGERRLAAESQLNAPIYLPDSPEWYNNRSALAARQMEVMKSPDGLAQSYIELLVRAHTLIEFIDNNVGDTDDWPMQLFSESDEGASIFNNLTHKLKMSIGCLTEV